MSGGFSAFATPSIGTVSDNFVGRTVASAVVGGTTSVIGGGKFANGAKTAGFLRLFGEMADYYQRAVGRSANPLPGENRDPSDYLRDPITGRQPDGTWDQNVIGLNEPLKGSWYAPGNFFKQGGLLSRSLNLVPIMNATGGLHDYWFNSGQLNWNPINNVGAMLPAAAISTGAVFGNLTQGWDSNPTLTFYLTMPRD